MKLFFLILPLLILNVVNSYAQVTFQKTFRISDTTRTIGTYVQQTADSGYIVTGYTIDLVGIINDIFLTYLDINGNIIWTKTYGNQNSAEAALYVEQTSDGGYIIAGGFGSSATKSDIYLLKTDANGDTIWTRTYGKFGFESGFSVHQTPDGGYIILGYTAGLGGDAADIYLLKVDILGNLLWTNGFHAMGYNLYPGSFQPTTDGGYIFTGITNSFGAGNDDVLLLKTDSATNFIWMKAFGGGGYDWGRSVQQTIDGGYVITGYTNSFGNNGDVYLIKTDANGNSLWSKNFGGTGNQSGFSVQQTTDKGYIIAGNTLDDTYLIKTDSIGNTMWTKTFGVLPLYGDYARSVKQTFDGGYIIVGATFNDAYIIKTDSNGNSNVLCYEGDADSTTNNPATVVSSSSTIYVDNGANVINQAITVTTDPPVSVHDFLPVSISAASSPAATGNNDGMAWVTVQGGSPPFLYLWDDSLSQFTDTAFNLAAGIYQVKVFYGIDCVDSAAVEVFETTGIIEKNISFRSIQIYPNPNKGQFSVNIDLLEKTNVIIKIYRIDGKLIYSKEVYNTAGVYTEQIDMGKYAKGLYYLQIMTKRGVVTNKVIYQ